MAKQDSMKAADVALALLLGLVREAQNSTYAQLGATLGISASTAHESMERLARSGLLRPGTHETNRHALRNFLVHGVRHVFPPVEGKVMRGVPTSHSAPALSHEFDGDAPVVWPDRDGAVRGKSLAPLYPKATELPLRCPKVYDALTLIDALRIGEARERNAAIKVLDQMLEIPHA